EQWALFENENLSDFSQQIIRENINIKPVDFNLKELNYIVFPDWLQPEESIRLELQEVIKTLATHPDSEKITLLIYAGNVDTEEAEMLISAIAMNLLMEDNLHISQDLQISLIGELFHREWESLLPFITERIVLSGEDEEMLKKLVIRDLNLAN
ncbi:hypothetical protein IQ231_23150, partial [Cuspidothrix issatschenkoi LEGE 03284]|nr:hypothetical protein [Cuspidothrix issatschenkoi LEGE 03284]